MKLSLVTDSHFGSHRSSDVFLKSSLDFFKDQLFPDLKSKNIDTIIHLGDFWDDRNNLNIKVLNEVYDLLTKEGKNFTWYILIGNHDSVFKTTITTHSLKQFKSLPNVNIIEDIEKIKFDNRDILLVPWQTDKEKFIKRVNNKNLDCEVCLGHLEVNGFYLNKGKKCEFGVSPDLFFNNFKLTISGHFHRKNSIKRNNNEILYMGNCYQLDRSDIGQKRGYTILDTDTLECEFIENKKSLKFVRVFYPEKLEKDVIENNIVDVHVTLDNEHDETKFRKYLEKIESFFPVLPPNVKIETKIEEVKSNVGNIQTINELMEEYVENLDIKYKEEVSEKLVSLYEECKKGLND